MSGSYPAEPTSGTPRDRLIERKQMSTKRTLKRIALVAVSALGFGLVSAMPSQAAGTFTSGTTLSASHMTIVGTLNGDNSGLFYVDLANNNTVTTDSSRTKLFQNETLNVSVTGVPNSVTTAANNVTITPVVVSYTYVDPAATDSTVAAGATAGAAASVTLTGVAGADGNVSSNNTYAAVGSTNAGANAAAGPSFNRYWFAVSNGNAAANGAGYYTLRVRLQNTAAANNSAIIDKEIRVAWVADIADAGAKLTVSRTGLTNAGETIGNTSTQSVRVTLQNADNGRLVLGNAITRDVEERIPALNVAVTTSAGVVLTAAGDLTANDNGSASATVGDHLASTATASFNEGTAANALGDGVYGITGSLALVTASTTHVLRVRVDGTSVSSLTTTTFNANPTHVAANTDLTLTASGVAAADLLTKPNVGATTAYTLPLTAKTATLEIDVQTGADVVVANALVLTTVAWSGNFASADVSPATQTTAVTNYSDANGAVYLTVSNANPLAGAVATITITGFDSGASRAVTLTWAAPAVAAVSVLDPVAGVFAKTGSTTTFTLAAVDQFGNGVSGVSIRPTLGTTGSINYSAATSYAAVVTGANGTATWSLTDTKAAADDSDTVTFTPIGGGAAGSYTITYKATLPAVSTMQTFFDDDFQQATPANPVPSTGIYTNAGGRLPIVIARDQSRSLLAFADAGAENDMIAFRVRALTTTGAGANGAALTVTASAGGHVLSSTGLPASSRTFAVPASGDVTFQAMATKSGAITFTITAGTASTTASMWIAGATNASARTVTLTGEGTGTANNGGVPMTVLVTDRFGNPASGVNLTMTAGGVGSFAGGSTTQSFTTDASGTYTFLASSNVAAGGSGTFSVTASNATDASSIAGYVGATAVDSTVTAGVATASKTVTFAAGKSAAQVSAEGAAAAAEAASDAAAEAIDAANAATDAANLAAEAADAATVAAEEARDAADAATAAVEELATQVATLMAALKAQITTLANTVAKIAKKVRA
jgi:hypothetical protein